jgi:hypothetical protein
VRVRGDEEIRVAVTLVERGRDEPDIPEIPPICVASPRSGINLVILLDWEGQLCCGTGLDLQVRTIHVRSRQGGRNDLDELHHGILIF